MLSRVGDGNESSRVGDGVAVGVARVLAAGLNSEDTDSARAGARTRVDRHSQPLRSLRGEPKSSGAIALAAW